MAGDGSQSSMGWVARFDEDGDALWVTPTERQGLGVVRKPGGDVVAVGSLYPHMWIADFDADTGALHWTVVHPSSEGTSTLGRAVAVDSESNLLVAGTDDGDTVLRKFTSDGDFVWEAVYNPSGTSHLWGVAVDSQDDVVVTGSGTSGGTYALWAKFSPDGEELWVKTYSIFNHSFWARHVAIDSCDQIVMNGFHASVFQGDFMNIRKVDASGDEIWTVDYQANGEDVEGFGVGIGPSDEVVAGGWRYGDDFGVVVASFAP